jgi:hypothetical protein
MMSAMGAQGTNAFTSFEQTVYTDDVPSSSLDKYLLYRPNDSEIQFLEFSIQN